jgi:tRNA threonylcarbamoyladenosine biosynthesis protein TsaB
MRILALDTSSRAGSAALLDDDRLIAAHQLDVSATHSERLLPAVDRLLADAGWTIGDIELLACAKGPGSFTGLRIGIASAKGIAVAAELPLVGVNSLEATAQALAFAAGPICPMIDARKRQVYAALFQPNGAGGLQRLRDDVSTPAGPWAAGLGEPCLFVGDGAELYREEIRAARPDAIVAPMALCCPRAASVGWLGRRAFLAGEKGLVAHYVRPSDAELNL